MMRKIVVFSAFSLIFSVMAVKKAESFILEPEDLRYGGAIHTHNADVNIDRLKFYSNQVGMMNKKQALKLGGGAVAITSINLSNSLNVRDVIFDNNRMYAHGTGYYDYMIGSGLLVYFYDKNNISTLNFDGIQVYTNNFISGNSTYSNVCHGALAIGMGGFYSRGAGSSIITGLQDTILSTLNFNTGSRALFKGNIIENHDNERALGAGMSLNNLKAANFYSEVMYFHDNKNINLKTGDPNGIGGGLMISHTNVNFDNPYGDFDFYRNSANRGGGIGIYALTSDLGQTHFRSGKVRFYQNNATYGGGMSAASYYGSYLNFYDAYVDFIENEASFDGGGVYGEKGAILGTEYSTQDINFLRNRAGRNGGAVYIGGTNESFNTTKKGNTAKKWLNFKDNRAENNGGAIYVNAGGTYHYYGVKILHDGNTAGNNGSSIYMQKLKGRHICDETKADPALLDDPDPKVRDKYKSCEDQATSATSTAYTTLTYPNSDTEIIYRNDAGTGKAPMYFYGSLTVADDAPASPYVDWLEFNVNFPSYNNNDGKVKFQNIAAGCNMYVSMEHKDPLGLSSNSWVRAGQTILVPGSTVWWKIDSRVSGSPVSYCLITPKAAPD